MNNPSYFYQYTADYISGVMNLRKPQKDSLNVLEEVLTNINIKKGMNLKVALAAINAMYPTCSDFERDFISLTFALATGVGKTRLMGAFIAYLYTQHGIKNFFVVAPNITIYDKLRKDLGDPSSAKYVFKGLGCFSIPPYVVSSSDYNNIQSGMFDQGVKIYVFNIDKFNSENANMKHINEYLGQSFFDMIASLEDLVLIMDESHHYRADAGSKALNDLKPLLGLELTATPIVNRGNKQIFFKNVVIEYPLSQAIADGYTRTPFALTRPDVARFEFGEEQLDKLMINDGILWHENMKVKLNTYAYENGVAPVKPFMLIVCKDTSHASRIQSYVTSDDFRDGAYKNKTIIIHSKQSGMESDTNLRLLLDVERYDNPVEIVIHVNKLKEGWDVNNLYTIVPLRQAASKILREQMVGRGLRLPYGVRTSNKDVDSVVLTAHDKFDEIMEEARKGDSIFNAGKVINAEDIKPQKEEYTQISLPLEEEQEIAQAYKDTGLEHNQENHELLKQATRFLKEETTNKVYDKPAESENDHNEVVKKVADKLAGNKDLAEVYKQNKGPLFAWMAKQVQKYHVEAVKKFIPIPHIKVTETGAEEYTFTDFDIDLSDFTHKPLSSELLIQSLKEMSEREIIHGNHISFDSVDPQKEILNVLRQKPEINYEDSSELLFKLISQVCEHYKRQFGENGLKNIVMMNRNDISNKIYSQMMQHFVVTIGFIKEEVVSVSKTNIRRHYSYEERRNINESYKSGIKAVLFDGIKYGVFDTAKFDSNPELILARVLERDASTGKVINWLRPAKQEFNLTYNRGHQYEPDFVVELNDMIYLVEVKGEDKIDNVDVLAKKHRAITYCEVASRWAKANHQKEWRYVFIPSKQISEASSFDYLATTYLVNESNVDEI